MFLDKTPLILIALAVLACTTPARAETAPVPTVAVETVPRYSVTWPSSWGAVDVYASLSPTEAGMVSVRKNMAGSSIQMISPFPGTHRVYFFVKPVAGGAGIWVSNRLLPLDGVANFRDMGGYETADHHRVRWGQFYRSAAPGGLTPADYALVDTLGIRSVTDLRTQAEQQKAPTHWQGQSPAFYPSAKTSLPPDMTDRTRLATMTDTQAKALMEGFYATMPTYYAPELKALFTRLLARQTPTLTHCTAGKDRTGFASALILSALGVPEQAILSDYAMSGDLLRAHMTPSFRAAMADHKNGGAMAASPAMTAMLNSDPDYLSAAFASIRQHYGSVDAYLEKELGVGPEQRATLRKLYLD